MSKIHFDVTCNNYWCVFLVVMVVLLFIVFMVFLFPFILWVLWTLVMGYFWASGPAHIVDPNFWMFTLAYYLVAIFLGIVGRAFKNDNKHGK